MLNYNLLYGDNIISNDANSLLNQINLMPKPSDTTTTKLTGFIKTLNSLKNETGDTYLIEYNERPITFHENTLQETIASSYSRTIKIKFEEDEQEEERLNKKEIANKKNATKNLHKAMILAKQIKEDLIKVETAHTMLIGSRSFAEEIKTNTKKYYLYFQNIN